MKRKDPDKIELIYTTTLALVKENGLAGFTMPLLAKRSGLGTGTLYVYFKSKEELVNSLFKYLKRVNTERIYQQHQPDHSFKPSFLSLVQGYVKNRVHHIDEHFFIEQCTASRYLDREALDLDQAAYAGIYALLDRGKQELLVKELPNETLTAFIVGGANELVNQHLKTRKHLSPVLLRNCYELCWDCIKQ